MKKFFTLLALTFLGINSYAQSTITLHDYSAVTITGDTISLSQYYGKKLMIVNTASFCGYTPQFTDLQNLYSQYQQYNFEIIGFPCNDFNGQDPNSDSAIHDFCTSNYGVTFQMMSKIATISADTAPVYKWLQRQDLNGVANAHVEWNFNKFLIDEAGNWVAHHIKSVNPLNPIITDWIMSPSVISTVNSVTSDSGNLIQLLNNNEISTSLNLKINNNDYEKINIGIYSSDGKFINTIYAGTSFSNQHLSFNVSLLSAGMYFIKAESDNAVQTVKYVVLK